MMYLTVYTCSVHVCGEYLVRLSGLSAEADSSQPSGASYRRGELASWDNCHSLRRTSSPVRPNQICAFHRFLSSIASDVAVFEESCYHLVHMLLKTYELDAHLYRASQLLDLRPQDAL